MCDRYESMEEFMHVTFFLKKAPENFGGFAYIAYLCIVNEKRTTGLRMNVVKDIGVVRLDRVTLHNKS